MVKNHQTRKWVRGCFPPGHNYCLGRHLMAALGDVHRYPRPRGAAPHGPGGLPKRWNHATGAWDASAGVELPDALSEERATSPCQDLQPSGGGVRRAPTRAAFAFTSSLIRVARSKSHRDIARRLVGHAAAVGASLGGRHHDLCGRP